MGTPVKKRGGYTHYVVYLSREKEKVKGDIGKKEKPVG